MTKWTPETIVKVVWRERDSATKKVFYIDILSHEDVNILISEYERGPVVGRFETKMNGMLSEEHHRTDEEWYEICKTMRLFYGLGLL